jgi:hypothetical protein
MDGVYTVTALISHKDGMRVLVPVCSCRWRGELQMQHACDLRSAFL